MQIQTPIEWTPSSMLEVLLNEPDDFLKIKETLTRIGVASKKDYNTLFQSCHILHKQGRYFIVHFKELLCSMENHPILQKMILDVGTLSLLFYLIGVYLQL